MPDSVVMGGWVRGFVFWQGNVLAEEWAELGGLGDGLLCFWLKIDHGIH